MINENISPLQIISRKISVPQYGISIEYPVVVGMNDITVENRINNSILSLANNIYAQQIYQLTVIQGIPLSSKMEVMGWYEIKTNEKGVFSLSLGNYTYAYPSAHGLTIIRSLTFDIQTGKSYTLDELFKPGNDYRAVLSAIVAKQIQERKLPLINEFKSIKGTDQDYYIADKALVLYFQLYELTPYYYGFPYFPISVYQIQDIIRQDSPLGKML